MTTVPPRVAGWPTFTAARAPRVCAQIPKADPTVRRRAAAEDLWDLHGKSIYCARAPLLCDEAAATQAVTLGMTDFARSTESVSAKDARRSMARHVYWRSQELAGETSKRMLQLPPAMVWLGQLAQLQRACLALCIFGGHTYREAAGLLGVPPKTVAELLTAGLREVGRLTAHRRVTSPVTRPVVPA